MKSPLLAVLLFAVSVGCSEQPGCEHTPSPVGPVPIVVSIRDATGEISSAERGATIEITGENFTAVRSIRFNGAEADLRTAEISATKILVVIPLTALVVSPGRSVDDELEVANGGGSVVFKFILLPAPPTIASLSARSPLPGSEITIMGTNFFYVKNVTFPGATPIEVTDFSVNSNGTWITVTVPAGYDPAEGYIFVHTLSGDHSIRPDDPSGNRLDITDIRYLNTSHGAAPWEVRYDLRPGAKAYVDREYIISAVPEQLLGSTWISTATNSRTFNTVDVPLAAFDINRPADIYIARNKAGGTKVEEWLEDWEALPQNESNHIVMPAGGSNPDDIFYLYRKPFPAGTVEVYRNGMTNRAPYIVIVK